MTELEAAISPQRRRDAEISAEKIKTREHRGGGGRGASSRRMKKRQHKDISMRRNAGPITNEGRNGLRDYVNATLGFQDLEKRTLIPAKSLMRMLGPKGSASAANLSSILTALGYISSWP
jgi:hypothetical protein